MPILHRDFETRSFADLKRVGAARYAEDPTTEVTVVCFAVDDGPIESWIPASGEPVPKVFVEAANNPGWHTAAHNDAFESFVEQYILEPRFGWPLVPIERHICTMAMARFCGLPGGLERVADILALPTRKDADGRKLMLRLCRPQGGAESAPAFVDPTPKELTRYIAYCANDVAIEREVMRRLAPLPEYEHRLWCLDRKINVRGFAVDLTLAARARELVQAEKAHINTRMRAVTGGAVDGFTKLADMREFINARGHSMSKANKRSVTAVLAHDPADDVREVLELRQVSSNVAVEKYRAVLASAFPDQRIRGLLNFYGTVTGRWTSAGANIHNVPRQNSNDASAVISAIQSGDLERVRAFGPPLDVIAGVARGLIVAPPGKRLLIGDFSMIEPRVAAWVSDERWKLDSFRAFDETGDPLLDPYRVLGAHMRGRPVEPNDAEARQHGKTVSMAFNYGASVSVWRTHVPDDPRSDEAIKAQEVVKFRHLHPAQTRFMYDLDVQALCCVRSRELVQRKRHSFEMDGDTLILRLPSGRSLFYPRAHVKCGKFGRDVVAYHAANKNRVDEMWYGAWLAHLVSATARDLLVNALFKLDAAGYEIVLHVHDEIIAEVDADKVDCESFRRGMLVTPEWACDLPLAAKIRVGERYIETDAPIKIDPAIEIPEQDPAPTKTSAAIEAPIPAKSSIEAPAPSTSEIAESRVAAPPFNETPPPPPPPPPPQDEKPESPRNGGNGYDSGYRSGEIPKGSPWAMYIDKEQRNRHSSDGNVHGDSGPQRGQRTAQWIYRHLDQPNYLRVDRYDLPNGERKFYQHHWGGAFWVLGVKGTYAERKIPYRLPELRAALQANPDVELQICEGESDADTLARLGFVTTTNPGGALSWTPELTAWLRILGVRRATMHEDNDDKGRKRSTLLTAELSGFIKLKIARYPDVPEGEDVRWWLEHGHTKEELAARIAAAESATPPFPFINMSNWDHEPVPEQQWIVFGRIPRRQSVIFSGEGGVGKSIIQLHLSAATVLGRDWLGGTPEQGPALFIDCEDDQDVMHYRLAAIARHYDTCFTHLINGGLHLTSLVGQDTVLATVSRSGLVEPTALYNRLLQAADDIKPTMIGIAASANVFAGDENNRSQVQQFINLTTRLAIAANGALVLITHPSIAGISSGSGLSGSTQWHNAVRARFFLKSPKAEPGEQPDNELREIEFKKNQYGAMAENIPLRWQGGMFLPIDGATFDRAEQEARADEVFLELLRRFATENRYVSSNQGPTYAPALFAKEDKARKAGTSSTSLAAAMRRLFDAGKIHNEPHGKPSRQRFHLAVKP
jgi:RecA-family ATPase